MGEDLKTRLKAAHTGKMQYAQYTERLEALTQRIGELENELIHLEMACEKEANDVTKLEKGNMTSFFFKVTGKYEKTLEKEVKEAQIAKVELEAKQDALSKLKASYADLKQACSVYAQCEHDYTQLYNEHLSLLKTQYPLLNQKFKEIEDEMAYFKSQTKEIQEVLTIGSKLKNTIKQTEQALDKAVGWGTFDLLGGGTISDLAKHSHLDETKRYIEEVQILLKHFKTELLDVEKMTVDIHIEIGSFAKFADFFFDGFFADIYMQDRIKEAQSNVSDGYEQVSRICHQLETLLTQTIQKITHQQELYDKLVLESE